MTQLSRDTPQFYMSAPSTCPYLPGQTERKVFTNLVGPNAASFHDVLAQSGFRRSQTICYKPACESCRRCVSIRVKVDQFRLTRSEKRVMMRNADLVGEMIAPKATSEQYSTFRAYLDARHPHGGMADMTMLDYAQMIEDTAVRTVLVEYRKADADTAITGHSREPLIACALTDMLSDGLSMVYAFFEPEEDKRSLGTLMILDHVARARALGLPYLYLGYWVKQSPQMSYKVRFGPLERLDGNEWVPFEPRPSDL